MKLVLGANTEFFKKYHIVVVSQAQRYHLMQTKDQHYYENRSYICSEYFE